MKYLALLLLIVTACLSPGFDDNVTQATTVEPTGFTASDVQDAVDALPTAGGVVHMLAGVYDLGSTTIDWRSDAAMECEPGVVVKNSTGYTLIDASGTDRIAFRGCSFELNQTSPANYRTALNIRATDTVEVSSCSFDMSQPTIYDTHMAIVANGSTNVRVVGNRSHYMQFKLGGPELAAGTLSENIVATDNVFIDPYNFAISVVSTDDDDGFRGVVIARNLIIGVPSNGAIFVGPDGESNYLGELSGLTIVNNVIYGTWNTASNVLGILVGVADVSRDWIISGNVVTNDGTTSAGMALVIKDNHDRSVERLRISGNVIGGSGGFSSYGISIVVPGSAITVDGNVVSGARGIRILAGSGGIDGLIVSNNQIESASHSLLLQGDEGITRALVSGNIILTTGAWKNAVHRESDASPFEVHFVGNHLDATGTGGATWGGDTHTDESASGNVPTF